MTTQYAYFRERVPLATIEAIPNETLSAYLAAHGWSRRENWRGAECWDKGERRALVVDAKFADRNLSHCETLQAIADDLGCSVRVVLRELGRA